MKKIITSIFLSCLTAALFGQANTYFHDRIDTTLFAIADTVGHGANHYYATNLTPDFNVKQYVNGCTVNLFFKKGNTGSATLTLVTKTATLSSKTIRKANGQVLLSGDIPDSTAVILDYYNGSFRIAGIGVTASSSSWLLTGNSGTTAGTNFLGTTDAVDLVLKTNNTEKARISSAGILSLGLASTNNGSLLFRNSTNANTLTINSGVTSASHSWTLPTAQGAANTLLLNNGSGVLSWNTGGGLFWGLTGNAGTSPGTNFLGTTDSVDLVFKTNNLERMRLSRNFSAGGLGIGTNAPTARLHVVGSDNLFSTYNAEFRSADNSKGVNIANNGVIFINTSTYNAVGINMEGSAWIKSTGSDMLDLQKSNNQYAFAFLNDDKLQVYKAGSMYSSWTDGFIGIGTGGSTPSAPIHVISTGTTSATFAELLYNSANDTVLFAENTGKLYLGSLGIDSTAGDAATINQPTGKFAKDNSGSAFTLTNSLITKKTIILLTYASAPGVSGYECHISSQGLGSATITFTSAGVAAAPAATTYINFILIN